MLVAKLDESKNAAEVARRITIADAVHWVKTSCDAVLSSTIVKYFSKCGTGTDLTPDVDNNQENLLSEFMELGNNAFGSG